jgi:hypothetical protein
VLLVKLTVPPEQLMVPVLFILALVKLTVPAVQFNIPVEVIVVLVLEKVIKPPEQLTVPLIEKVPVELKEVPFPVFVTFKVPAIEEDVDIEVTVNERPPP